MKPFISIIVPTLNEEKYVPNLLKDLARQKNKNFEVIVIDAASEDRTLETVEIFKKKLKIKTFRVEKRDVVYQKNYGAEKAVGEYLVFIDADSRVYPSLTQALEKEIDESKFMVYLPTMVPQGGTYSDKILFKIGNFLVETSQTWQKPLITIGMMIFSRKIFNSLGGYKKKSEGKSNMLSEDHDIILRGIEKGARPKFLRSVKVIFSLRRIKKEGRFKVVRQYIISGFELLATGKREIKLDYDMGGHVYDKGQKKSQFDKKIKQYKNFLKKL